MSFASIAQDNDSIPNHETLVINSKILKESRIINIWTPDEYKSGRKSFPVLYMPDGGIKEDFPHIANTIYRLIKTKKIRPFILVGIENTQRRKDLTGPTQNAKDREIAPIVGGSEDFRNFIKNELFPTVDGKYHTTKEKGILGESLAGLFVTETFLLYPEMFNIYIAFDPSLWWNGQGLLKIAKEKLVQFPKSTKKFWFAGSNTEGISENTLELSKILSLSKGKSLRWKYAPEPNEKHNTIFRATKEKAFIWALGVAEAEQ